MKRRKSDLDSFRDGVIKKIDALARAARMNCDALEKECQLLRREIQKT